MRRSSFRSRLLAILATASAVPLVAGCCESRIVDQIVPLQGDAGVEADGSGCVEYCARMRRPIGCSGAVYELRSCAPTNGVSGEPAIRCEVEYTTCPSRPTLAQCGRRPAGFDDSVVPSRHDAVVGDVFARMARLEGASVHAFDMLQRELMAHGAPENLVRAAARAARDEARHEHSMTALAGRVESDMVRRNVAARPPRSLEEVAIENAVEGCVRETYGALVAQWQAQAARDPALRSVMRGIARDEAGHAALAWRIDAWIRTRLDRDAGARIDAARCTARDALATETDAEVARELVEAAGLPSRDTARRLFALASEALWS